MLRRFLNMAGLILAATLVACSQSEPTRQQRTVNSNNELAGYTLADSDQASRRVKVIGHRGSGGTHPQNTLSAMAEGASSGADYVELDLQLTQDNMPLLSHNSVLSPRRCRGPQGAKLGREVPIATLTAAQTAAYNCGIEAAPEAPPTFDSLLTWRNAEASSTDLMVHMKEGYDLPTFTQRIAELVKSHGLEGNVLYMASTAEFVHDAKLQDPGARFGMFSTDKGFCDDAVANGFQVAGATYISISAEEVRRCHAANVEVFAWTVNTEEAWRALIRAGVDGIITDYPRQLEAYLQSQRATLQEI